VDHGPSIVDGPLGAVVGRSSVPVLAATREPGGGSRQAEEGGLSGLAGLQYGGCSCGGCGWENSCMGGVRGGRGGRPSVGLKEVLANRLWQLCLIWPRLLVIGNQSAAEAALIKAPT